MRPARDRAPGRQRHLTPRLRVSGWRRAAANPQAGKPGNLSMRLSAKAQYACVAMVELACHHGDRSVVQVKNIADGHGISQRFLVQILLQLKSSGLIESTRGASGGYHLARPPADITLAEVIHAIDQA